MICLSQDVFNQKRIILFFFFFKIFDLTSIPKYCYHISCRVAIKGVNPDCWIYTFFLLRNCDATAHTGHTHNTGYGSFPSGLTR